MHERRVGIRPRDELAGRHPVEVREVEGLQMLMHGIAQVELNIEGNAAAAVPTEVGTDERHDPKGEQNDDPWRERRGVTQDHVVDDLALDERDDHLGNAAKDGAGERDDKVALVAEKVATETPHPALRGGALVSTAFAPRGDGRGLAVLFARRATRGRWSWRPAPRPAAAGRHR